jgi:hypothetical protein
LLGLLGFVEDRLVFAQETGGRVHRSGAQAAGIVLYQPGEVVPDAQSQVCGAFLREFRCVFAMPAW